MAMEICDLSDFDEWPLKKEATDIWEELDTIVSTFETSNFLGKGKGRCKERIDVKQLPMPRPVSPDCNKISSSAWNSQPHKPPSYSQSQPQESTTLTRPFCSLSRAGGRAVPEAWPVRVVPRKQDHDYSQQLTASQQAQVHSGSQGRIGTIDLCCDNFDGTDGVGLSGQKGGKIGAPWRHVKRATGAAGQQFAFLDGSVKIRDGCTLDRLSAGGGDGQPWSAASSRSSCKFLQPTFIQAPKTLNNGFAERARKGHVYWYIEEKPQLCVGNLRSRHGKCR